MTIEELYSQTNLNDYVDALPEYVQGEIKYKKKYKISVFNVRFKAVKLEKVTTQFYFIFEIILTFLKDLSLK
jgi:hypothetical protein